MHFKLARASQVSANGPQHASEGQLRRRHVHKWPVTCTSLTRPAGTAHQRLAAATVRRRTNHFRFPAGR